VLEDKVAPLGGARRDAALIVTGRWRRNVFSAGTSAPFLPEVVVREGCGAA
jgi:hypothetical protein